MKNTIILLTNNYFMRLVIQSHSIYIHTQKDQHSFLLDKYCNKQSISRKISYHKSTEKLYINGQEKACEPILPLNMTPQAASLPLGLKRITTYLSFRLHCQNYLEKKFTSILLLTKQIKIRQIRSVLNSSKLPFFFFYY